MKTTIDMAGRVVIPKAIRTQAKLEAGSSIEIAFRNGVIELIVPAAEVTWVEVGGNLFPDIDSAGLNADQIRTEIEVTRESVR
jgi:AbrB family looped-hinge helix DNA binding protein